MNYFIEVVTVSKAKTDVDSIFKQLGYNNLTPLKKSVNISLSYESDRMLSYSYKDEKGRYPLFAVPYEEILLYGMLPCTF